MQDRSRMAAWMFALALLAAGESRTSSCLAAGPAPVKQQVKLNIRLDGTKEMSGAELVIKPAYPSTRFKPITYAVKRDGDIRDILPIEVESLSASRDCSFAITLKEPGKPDKVFRRGLQLNPTADGAAAKPQVLQCYLRSQANGEKPAEAIATKPGADPARKR